jgi:hypothetical protein
MVDIPCEHKNVFVEDCDQTISSLRPGERRKTAKPKPSALSDDVDRKVKVQERIEQVY